MNINQLQQIFQNLPTKFINEFKEENFKTCWYGSAGLDTKLLDYFINGTPDSLLNNNVLDNQSINVYFFTDNNYNFEGIHDIGYLDLNLNFREGISSVFQYEELIRHGQCIGRGLTFSNGSSAKLVSYSINNIKVYCFYISIDDSEFEHILLNQNLIIDAACHAGGWAGDGPVLLNDLGVKFYLGNYPGSIAQLFNVNAICQVNWGLVGRPLMCPFYEIIN